MSKYDDEYWVMGYKSPHKGDEAPVQPKTGKSALPLPPSMRNTGRAPKPSPLLQEYIDKQLQKLNNQGDP